MGSKYNELASPVVVFDNRRSVSNPAPKQSDALMTFVSLHKMTKVGRQPTVSLIEKASIKIAWIEDSP